MTHWFETLQGQISPQAAQQFVRAQSKDGCIFVDSILLARSSAASYPHSGDWYYGVSSNTHTQFRNGDEALGLSERVLNDREVDLSRYSYITNALSVEPDESPPSSRVMLGPYYFFTYEFDKIELFEQQLSWMRSPKNPTDSRMGQLYKDLSAFADFSGITVVWSGNKSFHIHVVFDTALSKAMGYTQVPDVRPALMGHYDVLMKDVLDVLQPTIERQQVLPDTSLDQPEKYRRLPLGSRHFAPGDSDWGLEGKVPQLVMWEKWRERSAANSTRLFFRPELFAAPPCQQKPQRRPAASFTGSDDAYSADELDWIKSKMASIYPTYPEFVGLRRESKVWKAYFRNSASDKNPSSVMREDFAHILIQGSATFDHPVPVLPQPLGVMMRVWRDEFRRLLREDAAPMPALAGVVEPDEVIDLDPKHVAGPGQLEQQFAATGDLKSFLRKAVRDKAFTWIKAAEGMGKTSTLMELHHEFAEWLSDSGESTFSMYAFSNYETARAKCAAFNNTPAYSGGRGSHMGYHGVILLSFSKAYESALKAANITTEITDEYAAEHGYSNRWHAIEHLQPKVMKIFRDLHARMWAEIGSCTPVFFAAHATAHLWKSHSPTRYMWARDFWKAAPEDRFSWKMADRTELGLLVHDEVRVDDVLDIQPREVVEWATRLSESLPEAASLSQQYSAFSAFPQPTSRSVTFKEYRELAARGFYDWTPVSLTSAGAYPDLNPARLIYAPDLKTEWMVQPKHWWRAARTETGRSSRSKVRVAHRAIVLTTEELPSVCVRAADPSWETFDLEPPATGMPRDKIDVYLDASVTSKQFAACMQKHATLLGPDTPIIANKCKVLANSQTPMSARGSNEYLGQDIVQGMGFMSPAEHERLMVLNAYTQRTDCVGLSHMDTMNQIAGRNLGYRKRGDVIHRLVIHQRLFDYLVDQDVLGWTRYDFVLNLSGRQRKHYSLK